MFSRCLGMERGKGDHGVYLLFGDGFEMAWRIKKLFAELVGALYQGDEVEDTEPETH